MTCSGVYTALITPFAEDGTLDCDGFCSLVSRQKHAQIDGLLVLGTTGESSTLSLDEKKTLIKLARKQGADLPLMVGCGTNSTTQTLENIQLAAQLQADLALVISPYYNKPTQEGLILHFEELCNKSPLPIILYNHPGRTGVNLELKTLQRLVEQPKIVGIKETSGNIVRITQLIYELKKIRPEFKVLSGDDNCGFAVKASGGDGVVSVAANLVPSYIKELIHQEVQELNLILTPLFKALLLESNPIPIKAAMNLCGFAAGNPRLPLTPLSPEYLPELERTLDQLNLLIPA